MSHPAVNMVCMTVLDLDPPQPSLRLVSSNGDSTLRDTRYKSTTPLYGDARALYQQVLQYVLMRRLTIEPDALRMVLGTKQSRSPAPARSFSAASIWQLMFVDIVASCRTRKLDVPTGCAAALVHTIDYLNASQSFDDLCDDVDELYQAIDECTGGWVDDLPAATPRKPRHSLRSGRGTKRT